MKRFILVLFAFLAALPMSCENEGEKIAPYSEPEPSEKAYLESCDETQKTVAATGGELTLNFKTNTECTYQITEEGRDWIHPIQTKVAEQKKFIFNIDANTGKDREANITLQTKDKSQELVYTIVQTSDLHPQAIELITGAYNFGQETVFALRSTTQNVCKLFYKCFLKKDLDELLQSSELSLDKFIKNHMNGAKQIFSEEDLKLLNNESGENNEGLWIPTKSEPGLAYSMVYLAEEPNGGTVSGRIDTELYPLTIFCEAGDGKGNRSFDLGTFTVMCGNPIVEGHYFIGNLDEYDFFESVVPGMGMSNLGKIITESQIKEINTRTGLVLSIPYKPQSWIGMVVQLTYKNGQTETLRDKIMLAPLNEEGGPTVKVTSQFGDKEGYDPIHNVTFSCKASQANIVGAIYNMLTTEDLEQQLAWFSESGICDICILNSIQITDIDALNTHGTSFSINGLYSNTNYSLIVISWDINGKYGVTRTDITTQPEEKPKDYLEFTDPKFKDYLVSTFDTDGDFEISIPEAMAITEIHADCREISSLEGIEKLTHLQVLDCSSNLLTSLDLSHNYELTKLICSYNQISQMDVSQNTELLYLDCSGNQLHELDIFNATNITELYCSFNSLKTLSLRNNLFLEILYCTGCYLQELDLRQNSKIKELDCSQNQLTILNIATCNKMQQLDCNSNKITELNLKKMYDLLSCNCSSNQLTTLNVKNNYQMTRLTCGDNHLSELDLIYGSSITELNTLGSPTLKTIWVWDGFEASQYNYKVDSWTEFKVR